jgi:hypothetical protein
MYSWGNHHPNVDAIDTTMAALGARRDDGNPAPGDVVFTFFQAPYLVFDCRALRQVGMFGIYLQWDLHTLPFREVKHSAKYAAQPSAASAAG